MTWQSESEAETVRLGERFAKELLDYRTVVALRGELGAGKTHFTKGIAIACGLDERELTSPTFALLNTYEARHPMSGEPFQLHHLDCYRFEKPRELLALGVEDYFFAESGATIVEWPERIEEYLPHPRIEVRIQVVSETVRTIEIEQLA